MTSLVIAHHPNTREPFTYFSFTLNVVHLVVTIDFCQTFKSPLPSLQLQSLVLEIQFIDGTRRSIAHAARAAACVLQPACTNLQYLTLNLNDYDEVDVLMRTEAVKPPSSPWQVCPHPYCA